MLPGRVKIERQALVTGSISMCDPNTARPVVQRPGAELVDRIPRGQVAMEEERHPSSRPIPQRNFGRCWSPFSSC
jgi:hypothetical protein